MVAEKTTRGNSEAADNAQLSSWEIHKADG